MNKGILLIRLCSLCAIATAVTTFLLWFLPTRYESPQQFEDQVQLKDNLFYIARLWVNFVHIPLALIGYSGLVFVMKGTDRLIAKLGMLWFTIWGLVEMLGISILLFSVNKNWRENYVLADASERLLLKSNIELFYSIWDSMFFLLLVAFLLGTVLFGWATWNGNGIQKFLSVLTWLAVPLTVFIMLSNYSNIGWGDQLVSFTYPILQPVSRLTLGIFIWQKATSASYTASAT